MHRIGTLLTLTVVAATAGLLVGPLPAEAGGSSLSFDKAEYLPAETARARGLLSAANSPGSGWIDQGPYYGYLIETERGAQLNRDAQQWPFVPGEAVRVGEVRSVSQPACCSAVFTLEFVVPSLPRAHYTLMICNQPCTETLGDFTGGGIAINAPGYPPLTTAVAPDAATAAPSSAATPQAATTDPVTAGDDGAPVSTSAAARAPQEASKWWWWPTATIALVLLGTAVVVVRSRMRPDRDPGAELAA